MQDATGLCGEQLQVKAQLHLLDQVEVSLCH